MTEVKGRQHLYQFYMQAPIAICIYLGQEFIIEMVNPKMQEIWGMKQEEVIGKAIFAIFSEKGLTGQGYEEIFNEVFTTGNSYTGNELPATFEKNGKLQTGYFNIHIAALRDEDNSIFGLIHTATEVTENVLSRQNIANNEEALRLSLEAAKMGTWHCDLVEGKMFRSLEHDRVYGHKERVEHWNHGVFMEHVIPEDRDYAIQCFEKALKEGLFDYEVRVKWADGSIHYVQIKGKTHYNLAKTPIGMSGIVADVTEQKLALEKEKLLVASNAARIEAEKQKEILDDIFRNVPAMICTLQGPDHIYDFINPFCQKMFPDKELKGKTVAEAFPEIANQPFLDILNKVYKTGESFIGKEIPAEITRPDGTPEKIYVNIIYQAMRNAEGDITDILSFATDVTTQVKARKIVEDQNKVLQIITKGGTLSEAMDFFIRSIEESLDNKLIGSVLLLDQEGKRLLPCAAPNLPKEYNDAINGILIGPIVGSCGRAAFTKKLVIVSDVATDPLWKDYKDLALGFGLKSCWSIPILSGEKVLGTFALYSREIQTPTEEEINLIEMSIQTAKLVIERKQIEDALRDSEEHLRALITATSDVIYSMNPDWSEMGILEGKVFVPDTGKPRSDWFENNIPLSDQPLVKEKMDEAIRNKSIFQLEHKVKLADGNIGWTFSRAIPILNEKGDIIRWFGAASDITERKQAEEALRIARDESERRKRLYETVTSNTPDLIYVFDPGYRFIYVNNAILNMWGKTWDEVINKRLLEIGYDPIIAERHEREIDQVIATKGPVRGEVSFQHVILGERIYDYIIVPVINEKGEVEAIAGTTRDVTDYKLVEKALAEKNEELVKINNDLDNFIYTASHDLKAPISNLEGLFLTLIDEVPLDNDLVIIKSMIEKSFERFKGTIKDLTEISKVQKEISDDLEVISFEEIVEDVKLSIEDLILRHHAEIETDFRVQELSFSRKNMRSILYNFISNAIKYSHPKRKPFIKITSKREDRQVVLAVTDNGLGLSPTNQQKVFQMFKRFHDHVEGSGIGLYIVKRIIDNIGGRIELESEEGKGTTFKVFFPVK
ncbi:MAG: PAS domain-containing protein [Cytophagaceae bacterium]